MLNRLLCKEQSKRLRASEALEMKVYLKEDYKQTKENIKVNPIRELKFKTMENYI